MFLNKIFGKKNTPASSNQAPSVTKSVGYYAKKVAMLLGLGAAVSGPAVSEAQYTEHPHKNVPIGSLSKEQQHLRTESLVAKSTQEPPLKIAKALPGDSVTSFMQRSFGISQGWDLLVEKETGKRVINPRTDLIAGKEYILARSEKEALSLSNIYRKKEEKTSPQPASQRKDYSPTTSQNSPTIHYHIPHVGFDFSSFLKAISGVESGGSYSADNSQKGSEFKVSTSKHAKGKYQFTNETLAHFGYATEEDRKHFLRSPHLQEKLMFQLTKSNYQYAIKSPSLSQLLSAGVHMAQILASMHHRGSVGTEWVAKYAVKQDNPVEAFFQRLEQVKGDWLGTKTSKYVKAVSVTYNQIAKTQTVEEVPVPAKTHEASARVAAIENTPKPLPVREVSTLASNDERFDEEVTLRDNFTSAEEKETMLPPTIEFTEVASTKTVVEVLKETYKAKVLAHLEADASIPLAVRKSLVEKLSKVDDLEAYYQGQINHYNGILKTSRNDIERQKARKILPGLQKLLKDTRSIMASGNDDSMMLRKAA